MKLSAAGATDPGARQKLLRSYTAAIEDLNAAYDKAATKAASQQGRDELQAMKENSER